MSKYWEPCPRCGSNKVITNSKGCALFIAAAFAGGWLILGLFFWPLLFIGIPLALLVPLALLLPKRNSCSDCKHAWKVNKKRETST